MCLGSAILVRDGPAALQALPSSMPDQGRKEWY
jgi:hypothetical protein